MPGQTKVVFSLKTLTARFLCQHTMKRDDLVNLKPELFSPHLILAMNPEFRGIPNIEETLAFALANMEECSKQTTFVLHLVYKNATGKTFQLLQQKKSHLFMSIEKVFVLFPH